MNSDNRVGKRGEYPPLVTVSGGKIIDGADSVGFGNGYYGRLDVPHHRSTAQLTLELRTLVSGWHTRKPVTSKPIAKETDDDTSETP